MKKLLALIIFIYSAAGAQISTVSNDLLSSASIAANATSGALVTINGNGSYGVQFTGTFTATFQIQISIDGTNFLNITGSNIVWNKTAGTYVASGNITAVGEYDVRVTNVSAVRVISTAYTSGTAVITARASPALSSIVVEGQPAVTITSGAVTVSGTVTNTVGLAVSATDVASAAISTTTTTSAFTPTSGSSFQIAVPVTVLSGTTPGLDIQIQESEDGSTNWYARYDFPRISATGIYYSPKLEIRGNRVRYVQTVTGTSPSATRAILRLQHNEPGFPISQMIDRTIVLTTLSSTTPSLNTQHAKNFQLIIAIGAVTTTAPALQLQGSDDNGTTWYAIESPLTAVASSTVQLTVANISSQLVRAIVTTAGVGVTANYVLVKGF